MGKPKAHLFNDGGGMVTGTHDVKIARSLIVDMFLENERGIILPDCTWADRDEVADASGQFRASSACLETGRIVPNNPETGDPDYTWFWRSGYALGKPGVTRAVVWHA